jgi:hypothetical protein
MIAVGKLVCGEGAHPSAGKKIGIVVRTYPPTPYDDRRYEVVWQEYGQATIEDGRDLKEIKNND